jgi:hypothetical protein
MPSSRTARHLHPLPLAEGLSQRTGILGIDFASGKSMAANTWLCHIALPDATQKEATVMELVSLKALLTQRQLSQNPGLKLFERIIQSGQSLIGIDASFALPQDLMAEPTWEAWVTAFASHYPDADTFRAKCQAASPAQTELKRKTDVESKTPFSPYNLRHYKQCHTLIHSVLRPLVMGGKASVLPMQAPHTQRPWIVEVCPAVILKSLFPKKAPAYKGGSVAHQEARAGILKVAQDAWPIPLTPTQVESLLEQTGGDALDAFLIAWHLHRAYTHTPTMFQERFGLPYILEGRVY